MSIDRAGDALAALGVTGRDVRCLLLLPQIYVGWAIEGRDPAELEALLETTVQRAQLGKGTFELARGWVLEQPSRAQFQSAFALLRALRQGPEHPSIASSDLLEAMLWASRAAQRDRSRPDSNRDSRLSPAVARALFELESWLEIDATELWEDLIGAPSENALPFRRLAGFDGLSAVDLEDADFEEAELEDADAPEEFSLVRRRAARPRSRGDSTALRDAQPPPASAPFPLLRRLG